MILSSALVHALAWAAIAAYALSALARPAWGARVQAAALVLHGLSLAATFVGEADAGQGIRWGFAPVLSLTAWLVLAVHFTETRLVPISGLRRAFALLRPGGLAVFQVPTYARGYAFRLAPYLAGLGGGGPDRAGEIEMHVLPQPVVFLLAREAGCDPLEVLEDLSAGPSMNWNSTTFVFRKRG